mmetsp:Transcript_27831/g.40935  ORF Transcript_27831/g.40935 Transcript_27831/m.40935 type:complete len:350 (+) Transcript_27831:2294-3343(+)
MEGLGRQLAEHLVEGQVDGDSVVLGVVHNNTAVARDGADNAIAGALTLRNLLDHMHVLGSDERTVVLLVLGAPDLENRHRVVAENDVAQVNLAANRLHDFLKHVAVAAATLVMERHNRVAVAQLTARADDAIHFLLHLCVSTLHCIEVELTDLARGTATGRSSTHADAVSRASHLDNLHSNLRGALPSVASIHLTEPAREKNGLDPLTPLATGSARSIRTSETADERLAVFVTVVRCAIGTLNEDVEGSGHGAGVGLVGEGLFVRLVVANHVEGTHAVADSATDVRGSCSSGLHVAKTAAGASFGTCKGAHTGGHVVRLGGVDEVNGNVGVNEGARTTSSNRLVRGVLG